MKKERITEEPRIGNDEEILEWKKRRNELDEKRKE